MNTGDTTSAQPPPASPPPYGPPPPRLTRSTDDKVVSGLCGGLGRHFGVDPVVFRIAFVVLALAGGSGVLLYLVGWLMVPDDRSGAALVDRARHGRSSQVLAAVLVGVGAIVMLDQLGEDGGGRLVGLVLLGVGAAVLWSRRGRDLPPAPSSPTSAPPTSPPPGGTPVPPAWAPPPPRPLSPPPTGTETVDTATDATATDMSADTTAVDATAVDGGGAPDVVGPPGHSSAATATSPITRPVDVKPKRPPSFLVPITLSVLAILAGVLALLGSTDAVDVPVVVALALPLLVIGAALCVGARWGRAKWLIPLGLVLSVGVMAAAAIDVPIRGGVGDRVHRPLAAGELQSPYRLGAGDMMVDLAALDPRGSTLTAEATLGVGDLEVVVPDAAEVVVDVHAGAGDVVVFGRQWDGFDVDRHVVEPGREGGGRLVLTARVGFGKVEVRRASA